MPPHDTVRAASSAGQPTLRIKIFVTLGAVLIGFALAEAAVRIRQYVRYGATKTSLYDMARDNVSGLMIPTPSQQTGSIRIDTRGFRNPELSVPKPAGTIRLAFLGASTTFCAEVSSNAHTWPDLVTAAARQKWSGTGFDYVNAGVPGYKLTDIQVTLDKRVAPLAPDVIIFYEATNDLTKDTRLLAEAQGLVKGGPVDNPSWLAKYSAAWFLIEKNMQLRARQQGAREAQNRLQYDAPALATGYEKRLRDLVTAAQKTARLVVLTTFTTKARRQQTPEQLLASYNTALFYMPWMSVEGLLSGFEAYNDALRRVARDTGALLIEDEFSIPGDDAHFRDTVHFTDLGAQKQADRVTRVLLAAPQMHQIASPPGK
ncbi:MAG: SGNH/GDSL hydrolase family protein [Blastocatellia bacterium]